MSMYFPRNEAVVHRFVVKGILEIDDEGRIWRIKKTTWNRWTKSLRTTPCKRVRAERQTIHGYLAVAVVSNGISKMAAAHRLVWHHFKGAISEGLVINHLNAKRDDNRIQNLEVVTSSENLLHAYRVMGHGKQPHGELCPKAKLSEKKVLTIKHRLSAGESARRIARDFRVHPSTVSLIKSGKRWKHTPQMKGTL